MEFHENELYHIYNRGNNRQKIFFHPGNYLYFLKKVRLYVQQCCDILAYSLMPNHFHFVIHADQRTVKQIRNNNNTQTNALSESFRILLSSYTQAINKQNQTTGSLFQQNTKAKCLIADNTNYGEVAFHYVHQNAFKAGLVTRMEDWPYSSFPDYAGLRNGNLCNKELAFQLLNLNKQTFYSDSYKGISDQLINRILLD